VAVELADRPFTSLEASLERLRAIVSPVTGIVTEVVRATHAADEARLSHVTCLMASCGRTVGSSIPEFAGGMHIFLDNARAAALGEAVERYSAAYAPIEATTLTTAGELGTAAVLPERFALFHARQLASPQFPFAEFHAGTRLRFVEGFALADGRPAFVPSQLVYLGGWFDDEERIGLPTSNGVACGATLEEAILAGLLELIERDAVMLAWKNTLSLPLLDWTSDTSLAAIDHRVFAPTGLRYSVVDGSAFFDVPVAIAVVHGPAGERTALAMGAAAGATISAAWTKALSEAFAVRRWLTLQTLMNEAPTEANDVNSFDDHVLFYGEHDAASRASFLDASDDRTPTHGVPRLEGATPRAQIAALERRLAARGCSAYAVEITSPDVAALGLHVARVVAPELCPLDVAHAVRFLGGSRLGRAAFEVGLSPMTFDFDDFNPLPHPFP
jgi:ribosomal protein S12 methylthiotransferase accessory factor